MRDEIKYFRYTSELKTYKSSGLDYNKKRKYAEIS